MAWFQGYTPQPSLDEDDREAERLADGHRGRASLLGGAPPPGPGGAGALLAGRWPAFEGRSELRRQRRLGAIISAAVAGAGLVACAAAVRIMGSWGGGAQADANSVEQESLVGFSATGSKCSGASENCWTTRCCANPKHKCFMKNEAWAGCVEACVPGVHMSDPKVARTPWTCFQVQETGPALPQTAAQLAAAAAFMASSTTAPEPEGLTFAATTETTTSPTTPSTTAPTTASTTAPTTALTTAEPSPAAAPTTAPTKAAPSPAAAPTVAPTTRSTTAAADSTTAAAVVTPSPPASPAGLEKHAAPYPSLFCFEIVRVATYEIKLVEKQLALKGGVFECDDWAVLADQVVPLSPGVMTTLLGDLTPSANALRTHFANTDIFTRAFDLLKAGGKMMTHDFAVKVDPDAVFMPLRLKTEILRLAPQSAVTEAGKQGKQVPNVYFQNCNFANRLWMFGAVEVLSKPALDAYFGGRDSVCRKKLDYDHIGEDTFLSRCLDLLGVTALQDFELLADGYCNEAPTCETTQVAFHPMKEPDGWETCFKMAKKVAP